MDLNLIKKELYKQKPIAEILLETAFEQNHCYAYVPICLAGISFGTRIEILIKP